MGPHFFFRPGNDLKHFEAYRKGSHQDTKGAITNAAGPTKLGEFDAVIATADPTEIERWLQNKHPISHTVVLQGVSQATGGDYLSFGGRKFYIQGKDNPGELGFWTIFYCNEQGGVACG